MAKKTLRGKRYLRSRRSVAIGRERRKLHKFNMKILRMSRFIKQDFPAILARIIPGVVDAINKIAEASIRMAEALRITAPEMHKRIMEISNELSKTKTTH